MKKYFILPFFALFFLVSCSKSAAFNKDLNGSWKLKSVNDEEVAPWYSSIMTFTSGGKEEGSYTSITKLTETTNLTKKGTYKVIEDTQLIIVNATDNVTDTTEILAYSKTVLKFKKGIDIFVYAKI